MTTLKISDLSVGDWVGMDLAELNMPSDDLATAYIEKLRKPIRIKGISEDLEMVLADIEEIDGRGSIMLKCEYLKPIPITAEILEKNGWKCVEVGDNGPSTPKQYYNRYEKWRLEATWGKRELIFDRMTKIYRLKGMTDCGFAEVHKLQHALRLSGFYNYDINL